MPNSWNRRLHKLKAEFLGKKWSVSLLFFPLLIWMCLQNGGIETAAFLLVLVLHESGHMLAAQAFGIEIEELQLLPFGCAAKVPGISYGSSRAEILTAAAGPGVNLLAAAVVLLIQQEQTSVFLQSFSKYHIGMAAINLLPVLPMDGGRIFCAALSLLVGECRATGITSVLGMLIGAFILAAGGFLLTRGDGNLTLMLFGIFMLGASRNYYQAAAQSNIQKLLARKGQIGKSGVARVHAVALNREKTLGRALTQLNQRAYNLVYVLDDALHPVGVLDEQTLSDLAVRYGTSARFSDIPLTERPDRETPQRLTTCSETAIIKK